MECEGSRLRSGAFFVELGRGGADGRGLRRLGWKGGRGGAGDGVSGWVGKKFDEVGVEEGSRRRGGRPFRAGRGGARRNSFGGLVETNRRAPARQARAGRLATVCLTMPASVRQSTCPAPARPETPCGMGRDGFRMSLSGLERMLMTGWEEGSRWRRGGDGVKGMDDVDGCGVLATVCRVLKQ